MKLSIIIPACNEEQRIGRMLDAYLPFFIERYGEGVEFLVVVNGSTDGTVAVVQRYEEQCPQLRHVVDPSRIGKGGALMRGFREARGDVVGFSDADGATPPESFLDLLEHMNRADCVVASRWRKESRVSPRQPLTRLIASRVFNLMTRVLFGLRLTDTQCGAKVLTRTAAMDVLPRLGITRWAFDVDLLFQLKRSGYRIAERPIVWCDVEGSKVQIGRTSFEMGMALIRLRLMHSPFRGVIPWLNRLVAPYIGRRQ